MVPGRAVLHCRESSQGPHRERGTARFRTWRSTTTRHCPSVSPSWRICSTSSANVLQKSPRTHPESRLIHSEISMTRLSQVVPIRQVQREPEARDRIRDRRDSEPPRAASPKHSPLRPGSRQSRYRSRVLKSLGAKVSPFLYTRDQSSDGNVEIDDVEAQTRGSRTSRGGRADSRRLPGSVFRQGPDLSSPARHRVAAGSGVVPGSTGTDSPVSGSPSTSPPSSSICEKAAASSSASCPQMPPHLELAACWSKDSD